MEWISVKDQLPPIGLLVECMKPDKWFYSSLNRDFFALVKVNRQLLWISHSLCDFDFTDLEVEYWKPLSPDTKGNVPYVKVKKSPHWWEPKVIYKKYKVSQ